ncbi:MAG: GDP-mannose 4,6-dehydratase [Candidatus Hodarchaeota archaeon]
MNLTNKRVMITGGAGFIGSHLAERLIELNNKVLVYDNFTDYYSGKENNIRRLQNHPNFTLIKGDILNFEHLLTSMKRIEIIFHLAAQPGVRYSFRHPHKTINVNTLGTLNVIKAAIENNIEKIVNASSSSVYGEQDNLPIKETARMYPTSLYGVSKLSAEHYCRIYHQIYDCEIISLRYFTVYGPRQRPDMAIHKFIKQIYEKKPISIYGDGKQTRDFTYIDDIVRGTVSSAEIDDIGGEVFNLGSGSRTILNDLINMLKELTEDFEVKYETKKSGDVTHTHADISKAKKMLQYRPQVFLKEGLSNFINWYKEVKLSK